MVFFFFCFNVLGIFNLMEKVIQKSNNHYLLKKVSDLLNYIISIFLYNYHNYNC